VRLWEAALCDYDELEGLDWGWLALGGAMTKAPLGGGKGPNPCDSGKGGVKTRGLGSSIASALDKSYTLVNVPLGLLRGF